MHARASVAHDVEQACHAAVDAARRIESLPLSAREPAIREHLALEYAALAKALAPLARELGVSLHISRYLLALGAAACGRLAPLTFAAVRPFIMQVPDVAHLSGQQKNTSVAQNMPSRRRFDQEARCMTTICRIAAFVDATAADDSMFSVVAATMRSSNVALAERIGQAAAPQRLDSPALTDAEDLAAVQDLVRAFGQRRTRVVRSEAERAAEAAAAAQIALNSARQELPVLDVTEEPRADDAPPRYDSPEDMVGRRIRINGAPYVYERILGTGKDHVVFELRNEETDERLAVKTRRDSFAPSRALARYLDDVGSGQPYDPSRVLRLSRWVLDLDPTDNVAAVNRGIALALTGALDEAHNWFEVALRTEPDDVIALFYDAYALAASGRHQDAVDQVARAADCDARGLAGFTRTLRRETDMIRKSLEAVELNSTPAAERANALKELFS